MKGESGFNFSPVRKKKTGDKNMNLIHFRQAKFRWAHSEMRYKILLPRRLKVDESYRVFHSFQLAPFSWFMINIFKHRVVCSQMFIILYIGFFLIYIPLR